jgi:hypothetical protein
MCFTSYRQWPGPARRRRSNRQRRAQSQSTPTDWKRQMKPPLTHAPALRRRALAAQRWRQALRPPLSTLLKAQTAPVRPHSTHFERWRCAEWRSGAGWCVASLHAAPAHLWAESTSHLRRSAQFGAERWRGNGAEAAAPKHAGAVSGEWCTDEPSAREWQRQRRRRRERRDAVEEDWVGRFQSTLKQGEKISTHKSTPIIELHFTPANRFQSRALHTAISSTPPKA